MRLGSEKSRGTRSIPFAAHRCPAAQPLAPNRAQQPEERQRTWQQLSVSSSKLSDVFPRLTSPPPQHCDFTGKGIRAISCPPQSLLPSSPRSTSPCSCPQNGCHPGGFLRCCLYATGKKCLDKTKFLDVGFIRGLGGGGGIPPSPAPPEPGARAVPPHPGHRTRSPASFCASVPSVLLRSSQPVFSFNLPASDVSRRARICL